LPLSVGSVTFEVPDDEQLAASAIKKNPMIKQADLHMAKQSPQVNRIYAGQCPIH